MAIKIKKKLFQVFNTISSHNLYVYLIFIVCSYLMDFSSHEIYDEFLCFSSHPSYKRSLEEKKKKKSPEKKNYLSGF